MVRYIGADDKIIPNVGDRGETDKIISNTRDLSQTDTDPRNRSQASYRQRVKEKHANRVAEEVASSSGRVTL